MLRHLLFQADVVYALGHVAQLEGQVADADSLGVAVLRVECLHSVARFGLFALACQWQVAVQTFIRLPRWMMQRHLRPWMPHACRSEVQILVQMVTRVLLVELLRNEVRLSGIRVATHVSLAPRRLLLGIEHPRRRQHLQVLLSYLACEVGFLLVEYFALASGLATSGAVLQLVAELLLLPVLNVALFERLLHDLVVSS